ncbi:putative mitochondrial nucleolar protein (NOP86) [Leptomonas pyrrhocoris]|uniref:Putative mitochondrial nucleolar protein (NOP86) n=1 Tax=Leptomonas pyrrhocoris TaxID=157538 RepID=A0A0N0DRA7_LEPPY|nr:putative mitochondrial nucleolar protein (NOP86) [Leptomonas pyrrhocoris]XP_015652623.1 putative mitochondrial nucleolar protein (NOP86) [Leptomonas pyrrhocoris]KPA74183.1 putative mitochondrial nucleolar protein (NOP86) [Leptomonas pyrrhocoris]KPA74184.1 putative mitochondrial nucleolar protein (NOP86) [Leptomonas pyrrhocoris]|eukprot:XP_015652622.1 putative mitochondrial nucleolar protein (NOP86) [Leptomonas pyrrhocoris]
MSESVSFHSEEGADANVGAVVLGDRTDLHIGDYVGFERISPNREWKLSLGKVIGFPSTRTVKVAHYDAQNVSTVAQDPNSEREVRDKAEAENKMDIWHNREALREDLLAAAAKEKEATERLFAARDVTAVRQQAAGEKVAETLEALDAARRDLRAIPAKEWKEVRNPCEPTTEIAGLIRSVMLVLYEDNVTVWEDMQETMRRPDFLDRLVSWDCTVTPMSITRRKKIVALCSGEKEETHAKKRRRSDSRSPTSAHLVVPSKGATKCAFPTLDVSMRSWLNAQLACSEAARAQENVINDCFVEQQEQRVLLREINDMRIGVSSIEYQMLEMKNAILGISDTPKAIMPLDAYPVDTVFYKRTYPDSEGRFVQEVILRESVVINFGPMADEDADGYVRLNTAQADLLRNAVITANVRHDAEEMEELLARKEREEQEMAELKARIDELRGKSSLTAEEEEELAQLEKLLADAERRHHATLSRIADLYACGRGAREITVAIRRPEFRYTRLHCKMSGDWDMILNDPERYNEMVAAFSADISNMLNVPAQNVLDIDARSGSLLIDFTVKHNGDLDDEELQGLVNKGQFPKLAMFYEKVTFKKTSPLNTSQQQEAWDAEQTQSMPLPISGMGIRQTLADYYNADGTLDEEFSAEVRGHPDYRKCVITIPPLREDYDQDLVNGPFEQYAEDEEAPDAEIAAASVAASTVQRELADEPVGESLPPTQIPPHAAAEEAPAAAPAAEEAALEEEPAGALAAAEESATAPTHSKTSSKTASKASSKKNTPAEVTDEL